MKIENKNNELLPISDLSLIGYLIERHKVIETDTQDPRNVIFLFKRSPKLNKDIEGFWNNTATVHPLEYFNNIKNLKTRIRVGN